MKCYTIQDGKVSEGIAVVRTKIGNIEIPVIQFGEQGRGRKLAQVRVELLDPTSERIFSARVEGDKVIEIVAEESSQQALCLFLTGYGHRGHNEHTGDWTGAKDSDGKKVFSPFPCEIIATGECADGAAGRMAYGHQHLAIAPKATWLRTRRTGSLYGAKPIFYYRFDGFALEGGYTWEERELLGEDYLPEREKPVKANEPVKVKNFSRHPFSIDQANALKGAFGDVEIGDPLAPFFNSAGELASAVNGAVASVVAPADFVLEMQADGLISDGTTLLFWRADADARKRGNHASTALIKFEFSQGSWSKAVYPITPTVETSFKDGATFKYGGDPLQ